LREIASAILTFTKAGFSINFNHGAQGCGRYVSPDEPREEMVQRLVGLSMFQTHLCISQMPQRFV
jgi:hypothetical protein